MWDIFSGKARSSASQFVELPWKKVYTSLMKSDSIKPLAIVVNVIIVAAMFFIHVKFSSYAFDDAYIHFRVARSQLDTGFPYFNEGDPVKVSSSSVWVVVLTGLLAAARSFGFENYFPLLVSFFNAVVIFMGMLIFTQILEALLRKHLSLVDRLLFQIPYLAFLLPSSTGLMETGFALLMVGLGILLLLRSSPWGFAILGLAVFVRMELLILLGLTVLFLLLQKRFSVYQTIGYSILGFVPFTLYDLYYYQTLIPHSVIAKPTVYSIEWFQTTADILFYSLPNIAITGGIVLAVLGMILLAYMLTTLLVAFQERKGSIGTWALLFCLWAMVTVSGYIIGRVFVFDWYRPLYMVPIIIGSTICLFAIENPKILGIKIVTFVIAFISAVSVMRSLYASIANPGLYSTFELGARVKVYQQVGAILHERFPNATLLTSEIGGLGYSFKGKILDAAGLASPDALDFHPLKVPQQRANGNVGAIPPEYVRSTLPDLIVSFDIFSEALLKDDVTSLYNQILIPAYLPEDEKLAMTKTIWGSRYLRIYILRDLPIPQEILSYGN